MGKYQRKATKLLAARLKHYTEVLVGGSRNGGKEYTKPG